MFTLYLVTKLLLSPGIVLVASPPADECTFIRQEISNLPVTGGEVVVPNGTYVCLSPIILDRSNVTLRGQGSVTLRLGNNINTPVIVMGEIATPPIPLHNIQVVDITIDGNRWYQKYECWGGPCDSGGVSVIRNNGITVRGVTNGLIKNVFITGARSGGVVTEKGCYDLEIDHLVVTDSQFDGFAGYETTGARISDLVLKNNLAAGISLDIRFHGNFFKNIEIKDNGDVGIFMRDSNSNIFEDVSISNSGNHGVFLATTEDQSTCTYNNEFRNLSVIRARGVGFRLNDVCEGNFLSGVASFLQNRDGCISEAVGARLGIQGQVDCKD
ncbi:MAG: right-handed parallel beta-helix repeat-containing protein [Bdellovibrionota bacterium]